MPPSSPLPTARDEPGSAAGIWSLDGDRLALVEGFEVGPAVVLVPSEQALLLTADLPLAGARRRAEALPFAIEDRIATPLAAVHIALGAEIEPQRHLAGVVAQEVMAAWVARLAEAGLGRAAIVPDALGLPVPAEGWAVDLAAGRALVRRADGTGFALPADRLTEAWALEGEPPCTALGEPLPAPIVAITAPLEAGPLAGRLIAPALDLRQGAYARPRRALPALWRRAGAVALIGLAAHGAIAAADTLALARIAHQRDADLRALAARIAPGAAIGTDHAPSPFLPALARVSAALAGKAALRSVRYDAAAGRLAIEVETADMAGLQQAGAALAAAGLAAEPGAASTDGGHAVGGFTIGLPS